MSELPTLAPTLIDERLDNGLRLVLLPQPSSALVALNLWYHVGSRNDPPERTGLAHLFEHMLFQGSLHVEANQHFQQVQSVGGAANASTSFDRTNYYETLPANCLELGLWLESDRLGFLLPALDGEKLEAQRSVVINERRQRIDNQPYGRAFETIHAALYGSQHPYGWPIIGHLRDIERISLQEVADFFTNYYSPPNLVMTIVGGFEPNEAIDLVGRYFGEIAAADPTPSTSPTSGPPKEFRQRIQQEDDIALPRIYMAWSGPPFVSSERYCGELLAMALAGAKSSPLYQDLVQQGQLAQDVTAFLLPMELGSTFFLVATARPDTDLDRLEARMSTHIEAASSAILGPRDLTRARNQVVTGVFEQLQSTETIADLLSQCATLLGDPTAIDQEASRYLGVEGEQMLAFARAYLPPERRLTLRVVPQADPEAEA